MAKTLYNTIQKPERSCTSVVCECTSLWRLIGIIIGMAGEKHRCLNHWQPSSFYMTNIILSLPSLKTTPHILYRETRASGLTELSLHTLLNNTITSESGRMLNKQKVSVSLALSYSRPYLETSCRQSSKLKVKKVIFAPLVAPNGIVICLSSLIGPDVTTLAQSTVWVWLWTNCLLNYGRRLKLDFESIFLTIPIEAASGEEMIYLKHLNTKWP